MTKCLHCGLTLADPPNGEGCLSNEVARLQAEIAERQAKLQRLVCGDPHQGVSYRAEVIDNAVLALAGGIKV